MQEANEHNFLPTPEHSPAPESAEFLDAMQQGGENRDKLPRLNDVGVDKASHERERVHKEIHEHDRLAGNIHTEMGMPLPEKALDNEEAKRLMNKAIESAQGEPSDQFDLLDKTYKM